jgi:hypothetical protein
MRGLQVILGQFYGVVEQFLRGTGFCQWFHQAHARRFDYVLVKVVQGEVRRVRATFQDQLGGYACGTAGREHPVHLSHGLACSLVAPEMLGRAERVHDVERPAPERQVAAVRR